MKLKKKFNVSLPNAIQGFKAAGSWLSLSLWSLFLNAIMLPYQLFRIIVPKKSPGRPGGHPLSKILRKTFESKRAKKFVGVGLLIGLLLSGLLSTIVVANEGFVDETIVALPQSELETQKTLNKPLEGILAQGFHGFHRGVDILATYDTDITSIANGTVIEVISNRLGWGNTVVVSHDRGLMSRYAHMNKMQVMVGDKIAKTEVLGTVGMTGWTTGPHLHLEIYQNGRAIDPLSVLPDFTLSYSLAWAE